MFDITGPLDHPDQISCDSTYRISGAEFLHCWVADSIWLERAESSITK